MRILLYLYVLLSLNTYYGQEYQAQKQLSLKGAIEAGLNNNPQLKSAKENISAVKGKFWQGISLPRSELSVSYEYTPVNSSLKNFGERTVELGQSFEFPTNYFFRGSRLNNDIDEAHYEMKIVENAIRTKIKKAYYVVLAKEKQAELLKENLTISEEFARKAEIRNNVGEGTNLEKLTASVQFIEAANDLESIKNEIKTAYAELNFILGYGSNSTEITSLSDSLVFREYNFLQEDLLKESLLSNLQIRIAELSLNSSSLERKLAWSSFLPGFNLSYFRQSRDGMGGFYGASFGISVPLWFLFEQRGSIQEAAANVSLSESQLELTRNTIRLNIHGGFNDYENNFKQVKLYQNNILPQAEEVYRSATASFDSGEITYLEYLQARQLTITSKNNYISSLLNYYVSIFNLEELVGQTFVNETVEIK